jgi:hypothetical protein
MMLFRRGNRKKSTQRTPLIRRLWVELFLFSRLKSLMKGARFTDVVAVKERVTTVLRSIPKEAFADNFQKLMNGANNVL